MASYDKENWKAERELLVDQLAEATNNPDNTGYAAILLRKGITRAIDEMFSKAEDKADFLLTGNRPTLKDLAIKSAKSVKENLINEILTLSPDFAMDKEDLMALKVEKLQKIKSKLSS